ncbi:MAG: hypothetical protein WBW53_19425 [Terriglobales bacterium]
MLKKYLPLLLAASLISVAAPLAAAQDSQSAPPANDQQSQPMQGNGHWHHGMADPAQRTKMLTKHLNLTADQQTKVQSLFESEQSQMQALHQDSSLSQQDRRSKAMSIRQSTDTQVRALLDPDQQKQWDEMQAKREQHMEHHHGGQSNSDDQQSPPSQQ